MVVSLVPRWPLALLTRFSNAPHPLSKMLGLRSLLLGVPGPPRLRPQTG